MVESENHALLALCFNKTKISFHCRKQIVREEKRKEDLFLVKLVTKRAGRNNMKKGTLKLEFFAKNSQVGIPGTSNCCLQSMPKLHGNA